MTTKPVYYYVTEEGEDIDERMYFPEELKILELLKDKPRNVSEILKLINANLKKNRTWYFIKSKLDELKKEGLVEVRK